MAWRTYINYCSDVSQITWLCGMEFFINRETDKPTDLKEAEFNDCLKFLIEFIFFKLKVMVTSYRVAGCAQNCSSAQKEGFFRLPSVVKTDETSKKLSGQRRDIWLSRINRKDLTPSQLAEKNSTLHVCGSRFILARPAAVSVWRVLKENQIV